MWPQQISGSAIRAEVRLTEARNDHELPHVLGHAVVLATGPMPEAPGAWLLSPDAALLPALPRGVNNPG
jgi:hypothetical protein